MRAMRIVNAYCKGVCICCMDTFPIHVLGLCVTGAEIASIDVEVRAVESNEVRVKFCGNLLIALLCYVCP